MSDLTNPAEDQPGDYIEAAIHALEANRPELALRYLEEGLGSRRVGEMRRRTVRVSVSTRKATDTLNAWIRNEAGGTDGR